MRKSFNAAGWTGERGDAASGTGAIYEAYDGSKLIIEHERLTDAIKLFDPRRDDCDTCAGSLARPQLKWRPRLKMHRSNRLMLAFGRPDRQE